MWLQNLFELVKTQTARQRNRRTHSPLQLRVEMLEERSMFAFAGPQIYGAELAPSTGIAADFNGDGRADLLAASINSLGVLLGNGDGTFQPPLTSAAGYNTKSIQAADLNSDGKTDLVTVSNNFGLDVRLGNGDGTFQPPLAIALPWQLTSYYYDLPYPVAQSPESVAVGDLDADGKQDLIVGGMAGYTIYYNGEGVDYVYESFMNVLLNNGDGTFRFGSVKNNLGGSLDLETGDFNNDGRVDVVSDGGGVLLGNGDGTLRDLVYTGVRTYFTSNPVNDFNRDGKLDLLSGANLYLGNGDGSFQPVRQLDPSWSPYSTVGDVNADGNLDVVLMKSAVAHFGEEYIYDSITARSAQVLLGNGDGTFAEPIVVDVGAIHGISSFTSAVLADFDGNGAPDLASAESFAADVSSTPIYRGLYVALNDGAWVAPPPTISLSDVTVTEGNAGTRSATFTVSMSAASSQITRVAYATANGTASTGSDYQASTGVVTFAPGETSKSISILINGDRLPETNETFFVNLSSPTHATIADGQGMAIIVDDEPRVSISDVSKAEGRKNQTTLFTFTVTLSAPYDQPVTMSYRTVNGTATTGNNDYIAKSGELTFNPGETTKTITITVKGDSKREANETFYLDLFGNSSNSQFTKNRGIGTILNDD